MSQSQALPAAQPTRRRRLADDAVVVIAVVLAVAAVLAMAWATRAIIVWVLAAGFLAFSIDPLVQLLRRKARVGNGAAIALATLVIGLVLFAIGLIILPAVVDGARGLLDAIPAYAERLEDSGFIGSLGAEDQVERTPRTRHGRSPTSSAPSARSWGRSGRSQAVPSQAS